MIDEGKHRMSIMIDHLQVRDRLVAVCLARFLDEDVSSILRGAFPLLLARTLVVGRKKGRTMLCIILSTNHAEPLEFQAFTLKPSILFMKTFLVQFMWQAFLVKSKW
jgi:hypothetical protein